MHVVQAFPHPPTPVFLKHSEWQQDGAADHSTGEHVHQGGPGPKDQAQGQDGPAQQAQQEEGQP